LFAALPANCGMAFVLIQHLDPKHESMMVELLALYPTMQEKGGLVIVQDPKEAAFDGMPHSAIVGGGPISR
jgi:chemotaxis response regulator CheB